MYFTFPKELVNSRMCIEQFSHRNKQSERIIENTTIIGMHYTAMSVFLIFPFVPDYMTILTNLKYPCFLFSQHCLKCFAEGSLKLGAWHVTVIIWTSW